MPNTSPSTNHLRLHVEESAAHPNSLHLPAWIDLQNAYQQLTGWRLDCQPEPLPLRADSIGVISALFGQRDGVIYRQPVDDALALAHHEPYARQLAEGLAVMLSELQAMRLALQQREAELATAVPVLARVYENTSFNHRLQAILRGAVEGLRGCAAAMYVLNDTTSELKLRAQWGLPCLRFLEPARPLRGAVADLEALTGHAVVLEDTRRFTHWNVPEAFASAVCVPVSSPEAPLGTFWFFSDEVRDYGSEETQLLEIVAGRLAVELERHVLVKAVANNSQHREQSEALLAWHQECSLHAPPVIDGWQVASALVPSNEVSGDFSTWCMSDENRLQIATASVTGPPARRLLSATLLQGALRATLGRPTAPQRTLEILNEVLWSSTPGGEQASTFVASLQPAIGRLTYATAGSTDAYILRPHGWEPIAVDALPLGQDSDWEATCCEQEVHAGDVLVVISDRHLGRDESATANERAFDTTSLAESLLRHVHLSAAELADRAVRQIAKRCPDPCGRSVLVIKRSDASPSPSPRSRTTRRGG